ncbi:MAG TPA: 4Fe-4S binding protein, partial [Spirochaetota bacterium]
MKGKRIIWFGFLSGTIVAGILGYTAIIGFIDPFSLFSKISTFSFRPFAVGVFNQCIGFLETGKNIYLHRIPNTTSNLSFAFVFGSTAVIVFSISAVKGRIWCNYICPVGAVIGLISRFSLTRIVISHDCISCGVCEKNCRGGCIDSVSRSIDEDRCVRCL